MPVINLLPFLFVFVFPSFVIVGLDPVNIYPLLDGLMLGLSLDKIGNTERTLIVERKE